MVKRPLPDKQNEINRRALRKINVCLSCSDEHSLIGYFECRLLS